MRLSVIAACCAALSLGACATSPAALVEGVKVLNDGCSRDIEAMITFAALMPASGTVKITKSCQPVADRSKVEPEGRSPPPGPS